MYIAQSHAASAAKETFDADEKRTTQQIVERAQELALHGPAAERLQIQHEFDRAINAAYGDPDRQAALQMEEQAALHRVGSGVEFLAPLESWKRMQQTAPLHPHAKMHAELANPFKAGTRSAMEWEAQHKLAARSHAQAASDYIHALEGHPHGRDFIEPHGYDAGHIAHLSASHQAQGMPGWRDRVRSAQDQAQGHHQDAQQRVEMAQMKAAQQLAAAGERMERATLKCVIVSQ